MHDIIVDTNPIMFFSRFFNLVFCCRFVFFFSLTVLCALRYFLPQWRQSKRSWWRRCWLPGWTRPPPTNIFNSFAVQEPPEKEVSQSWSFFNFSFSPQSTKCYQLYPCFKQYTRPPITKAFLLKNMCQRKGERPQPYICVLTHLLLLPALYFNSEQPF